ncbi:MAG: hypothetical protein R2860_02015 [Desulfobacterales bacterium]
MGLVKVRLYRPFSVEHFLSVIPSTVEKITVLDRTKEPGAIGDPLYMDICAAFKEYGGLLIYGGRYGLGSRNSPRPWPKAVFDNMRSRGREESFYRGHYR